MPDAAADPPAQSVRRLASTTLVTNLAIAVSSLLTVVVIGRALGPAGRGDVAAFQLIPLIGALVFALGLPHAASYFAAIRPDAARQVIRSSVGIAVLAAVPGALLTALAAYLYLGRDDSPGIRAAGLVFSISVLLLPIGGVLIHPQRSIQRTQLWNRLRYLLDMSLISVAIVVVVGVRSLVVLALVQIIWIAAVVVGAALPWWRRRDSSTTPVTRRVIIGFGAPTMLATLPYFLNFRIDQLILNAVEGSEELGFYATAVSVSAASLPVSNTIAMLALPRLAGRTDDRDFAAGRFIRMSVAIGVSTALALAALAPVAVLVLFGSAFAPSVTLAVALSFVTAMLGVTTTAEEVLRAYGDVRRPARAQLIGLVLNIALLSVLIPLMGAWGAVIASGATYALVCAIVLTRVRRVANLSRREMVPTRADVRALLSAVRRRSALVPDPNGAQG